MMHHRSWSSIGIVFICQLVLVNCQPDSGKSSSSNSTSPAAATQVNPHSASVANTPNDASLNTNSGRTGALTSPGKVEAVVNPFAATTDSTGQFGYVKNNSSNKISVSGLNTGPGVLTSVDATAAAGENSYASTMDPTGKFVDTGNLSSKNFSPSGLNTAPGALTNMGGVAVGTSRIPVTTTGITQK